MSETILPLTSKMQLRDTVDPQALALVGPAGVGKSTLADRLLSRDWLRDDPGVKKSKKYKGKPLSDNHDNPSFTGEEVVYVGLDEVAALKRAHPFHYNHRGWTYLIDDSVFWESQQNIVPIIVNDEGWRMARRFASSEYEGTDGFADLTSIFLWTPIEDAKERFKIERGLGGDDLAAKMKEYEADLPRYAGLAAEADMFLCNESLRTFMGEAASEWYNGEVSEAAIRRTLGRIEQGLRLGIKANNHDKYVDWVLMETVGYGLGEVKRRVLTGNNFISLRKEELIGKYLDSPGVDLTGHEIESLKAAFPTAIVGATMRYGTLGLFFNEGAGYQLPDGKMQFLNYLEWRAGTPQSSNPMVNFTKRSVYCLAEASVLIDDVVANSFRDHVYMRREEGMPLDRVSFGIVKSIYPTRIDVRPLDKDGLYLLQRDMQLLHDRSRELGEQDPSNGHSL